MIIFRRLWLLWGVRLRSAHDRSSWGGVVFLVLCWLAFSAMLTLSLFIRSEQGLKIGMDLLKSKDIISRSTPSPGAAPTSSSDVSASEQVSQIQMIAEALEPPDLTVVQWMARFSQERVIHRDIVLHIRPWSLLTERQKNLFRVQGVDIRVWEVDKPAPKRWDDLSDKSHFWVEQVPGYKQWKIYGVMSDMMSAQKSHGSIITDFEALKIILWSDDLVVEDKWRKAHPAPDLPKDLAPWDVVLQLIPSATGMQLMFWAAAGFVMLMSCMGGVLFGVSAWDSLRKEGVLETFMGLAFDAKWLVVEYIGFWCGAMGVVMGISALTAAVTVVLSNVPMFWGDFFKMMVLCWVAASVSLIFGVLVVGWVAARWWRMWVTLITGAISLALQAVYIGLVDQTSGLARVMEGPSVWALVLALLGLGWMMISLHAHRMERHQRLGFRKS